MSVPEGILVEYKEKKWNPTPSTVAGVQELIHFECVEFPLPVLLCNEPVSSSSAELMRSLMFKLCLPLPPPQPVLSQPEKPFHSVFFLCPVLAKKGVTEFHELSCISQNGS